MKQLFLSSVSPSNSQNPKVVLETPTTQGEKRQDGEEKRKREGKETRRK
jgi:hypothetical protein